MDPAVAITEPAWLVASLGWIFEHPVEAVLLLALAAGIEGLFLIGMVIPGSLLMFAAGAVCVAGGLPLWPVLLAAALGAWAGDVASFLIGRRSRHLLPRLAARWRVTGAVRRAEVFFHRHGGKSVVFGRLIGPLRPLVPAIAGASAMPLSQFLLIDLVAALLWAPLYALPGVLVGATLSVAAEITTRLALLLALLLGAGWLIWWLTVHAVRLVQYHAEPWLLRMIDWSHRHRRLGRLGPALADPDQPETPVLAVSFLALSAVGLAGRLWWHWPQSHTPPAIDDTVYDALATLLTPALMPTAAFLDAMTHFGLSFGLGLVLLAAFLLLRRVRAAAHWTAGLAGGALLGLSLPGSGTAIGPAAVLDQTVPLMASLCLWFMLAGLLATGAPPRRRIGVYVVVGSLVSLMVFARLGLGRISFSQAALAVPLALSWCALLLLGFRRHRPAGQRIPWLPTLAALLLVLLPASTFLASRADSTAASIRWDYAELSPARVNVLWTGERGDILASLQAAGWTPVPDYPAADYLHWLMSDSDAAKRPLTPNWLAGRAAELRLRRPRAGNGDLVLDLWPAADAASHGWLGQVGERRERRLAGLLHMPVSRRSEAALAALAADLAGQWRTLRSGRTTALLIIQPIDPTP